MVRSGEIAALEPAAVCAAREPPVRIMLERTRLCPIDARLCERSHAHGRVTVEAAARSRASFDDLLCTEGVRNRATTVLWGPLDAARAGGGPPRLGERARAGGARAAGMPVSALLRW